MSDATTQDLGDISDNVISSFGSLSSLITDASYVAGSAFAVAQIAEFKTHKDNPTQIPIGTPIALLFVGAALLFLPTVISTASTTK